MISVIINVYNGEKYIKKCLDSIINQTYIDLEILIINDGSTDNTRIICEDYKKRDNRIRIINQENIGLSLSRNVGIENAKGEYLYFIDSDDYIELDTIEYLYNLCKKYSVKMSTCKSLDICNYNYKVRNKKEKIKIISDKEMLRMILTWKNNSVTIWNKLIKKDLFENIRFEDRVVNDVVVTYKLALATEKIVYSNQIKYYYFKHKDSICAIKKENIDRSIDIYKSYIERYRYINNIYPNFIENKIGVLIIIEKLYLRKDTRIIDFLNKQEAIKLYKELFSIKIVMSKINFKEKIKLIIFRISPKFYKKVIKCYLNIKRMVI